MKIGPSKTAEHLNNHIKDVLDDYNLDAKFCAYSLEFTFGKEIHRQIDGFIRFAEIEGFDKFQIASALCHDLGGGIRNDRMMLPRVSDYGQYSQDSED